MNVLAFVIKDSAIFEINDSFGKITHQDGEFVIQYVPEYKIREVLPEFRNSKRIEVNSIDDAIKEIEYVC